MLSRRVIGEVSLGYGMLECHWWEAGARVDIFVASEIFMRHTQHEQKNAAVSTLLLWSSSFSSA